MAKEEKHLYNLDELSDYKVSEGYKNVQGWDVKDKDNRVIGKVDNLLVNLEAKRVVYLDVEVDKSIIDAKYDPYTNPNNPDVREFVNSEGENHIIVPIGLVDIDDDRHFVYTETVDHRTFAETKRHRKGEHLDRDYEISVLDSYDRKARPIIADENKIREIVREEVQDLTHDNTKEAELKEENKIRQIVKEEVKSQEREKLSDDMLYSDRKEDLSDKRERLQRDNFERENEHITNERKSDRLDFDHDNDGNPNITDPDYYQKKGRDIKNADYDNDNDGNPNITDPDYYEEKGRDIKNADYDHDNDGNPNITDPDYYEEKGRDIKNADYDHDNDGNPNITDPDYYEDKLKGRKTSDNDDFYNRREFENKKWNKR